jgi:hypothetical protein
MNISTINFDSFQKLKDEDCQERIIKAKKILGKDLTYPWPPLSKRSSIQTC